MSKVLDFKSKKDSKLDSQVNEQESTTSFDEIIKKNKEREERLREERKASNKNVIRNSKLK